MEDRKFLEMCFEASSAEPRLRQRRRRYLWEYLPPEKIVALGWHRKHDTDPLFEEY